MHIGGATRQSVGFQLNQSRLSGIFIMARQNSLRSIRVRGLLSHRTIGKLAMAGLRGLDYRAESLEGRVLLASVPGLLQGPVTSAATAAWYYRRIAALQALHLTGHALPFNQIRHVGHANP
jgi:hypothetical protein